MRNGTILYACIGDSLVQTDLESGESLYFPVNEGDPISLFTVSKDGKIALISTKSTLFFVFDLQQQRSIKSWRGYHGVPVELAIDPSNSICAACYSDRSMRIWELESGICLNSLKGFNNFCTFLDFDPTEVAGIFRLFCGGSEGQLNVYQTSLEGQCKLLFKKENAHASAITAIKISPASDYFVTFSRDKIVTQWSMRDFSQQKSLLIGESVEDGELVFEEPTNQQSANSVMFALGGENGSVSLWNFTNGSCLWKEEGVKVKNRQMITKLILISSSRLISFSSDHSIRTFSVLPNQLVFAKSLNGHKEEITDLCVLEDLLVASTNNESVKVFNRNDLFYCQELKGHSDIVLCLAVKRFQNTRFLLSGSKDNSACLWCKPDGKGEFRLLTEAVGHTAAIGAVAFSFDSNEISFLTASQDKTIKLWHLQPKSTSENTELNLPDSMQFELRSSYTVKAHDKDINAISVSPNNKLVLTCSQDKSAKLWNFHDGSFVAGLKGHKRGVSCAIFHPQEQVIATCSADKSIKLWSATDFSCIQTLEGHLFSILKISFIKQGAELVSVSSDGLVKIWSVKNGECLGTFDEHLDKIWAISFTPDFSQMYTGGADSCIKEWMDVTEQEERRLLDERNASIDASQRLGNMLKRKDYKNAFFLAFQLGQPYKLFGILKSLLTADGFDVKLLQEIISTVPREQLGLLLDYCKEWNTSFSKALVAQFVLAAIFTKWKPQELIKEPGMDKRIEALLPYTAKHVRKLDELHTSTFLIDLIV